MSNLPTRRGFLTLTGTGAAASLAGCSQLESITQGESESADDALTVTVQPDQETLTSVNEEISSDLESGNISRQEAQQRFQEEQQRLTEEAATPLQETAESDDQVSIEQSDPAYGFFLVDAPAETLVGALQNDELSAIYPADQYEQFAQQRDQYEQQQAAMENQGGDGTEAESNESDGSNESNDSDESNESTTDENESADGDSNA